MNAFAKLDDIDGSGRPLLSPRQEDTIDQARRTCSEALHRNRGFIYDAIRNNEEVIHHIVAAYLAGDMSRSRPSIANLVEAEMLGAFKADNEDFNRIEREWRAYERTLPRVVLPEVSHG